MPYRFTDPAKYAYRPGSLFLGLDPATNRETGIQTEIHAITIGGAGAGKGSSLLIPNARRWLQSLVCIDPKGENAVESWQAREALGQTVGVLDPFHEIPAGKIPDRLRVSVNLLADIDPESPRARAALSAIGNGLVVNHNKDHMEWTEGARALLAGLAAFVCTMPPESRTFGTLRTLLMLPNTRPSDDERSPLEELVADMLAADHANLGALIREAGDTIATALNASDPKSMERQFLGGAKRATRWLDDASISAALVHSDFKMSALKTGKASLFLVLPADYLADYSGFLRLFVKGALNAMGQPGNGGRCLFLLDEFYSLGKLDELTEAAGRMRSYGVQLWPFMQGISQLFDLYGKDAAQTFLTNAAARIFLGNDKDTVTLDYISYAAGKLEPTDIRSAPPTATALTPKSAASIGSAPTAFNPATGRFEVSADAARAFDTQQRAAADARMVEHENERTAAMKADADARADYDHDMKRVGQPRLTPDELAALIGKDEQAGEKVARSMIVFASAGDVLKLTPAPYFQPARPLIQHKPQATKTDYSTPTAAYRRFDSYQRKAFVLLGVTLGFWPGWVPLAMWGFDRPADIAMWGYPDLCLGLACMVAGGWIGWTLPKLIERNA
ncbi:type IV secretory system conjugative DNA transfer family protein [Mesorhizobium australicum]|uniref:Type IV secretory system Conjugative DNA transfer n=1 Tax=Mesorhizobium australicum TaxID=536018 RepID=A0A1X7MN72_9HYPH|nr:type IV secretory system conjugative DNA transfer family protein [Mesorhizobium australicum]SMH26054.1 Type IV secretory system Conjugative DNA transfer [Mesorhizobium australicum]SMH26079.1 Type IV secretory system Conjugative DNA transfer [Mesorhizobium australicum]